MDKHCVAIHRPQAESPDRKWNLNYLCKDMLIHVLQALAQDTQGEIDLFPIDRQGWLNSDHIPIDTADPDQ